MAGYSKSTRNTTGGLRPSDTQTSALIADYWSKFLREALYPYMVTRQFGQEFVLPEHTGDRVRLPMWGPVLKYTSGNWGLDGALTSIHPDELGETASPDLVSAVSFTELTALIRSFEGARGYSQKSILISHVDIIENLTEMMGKELAFRLDRYYYGKISGANLRAAQGGKLHSAGATYIAGPSNYLRAKDFIRFSAIMENAGVPTWDDGTYVMVVNPLSKYDIFTDTSASGFLALTQYGDPTRAYRGEIGTLYGIRLVTTALQKRYSAGTTTSAALGISAGTTGSHGTIYSPGSFFTLVFQNNGLQFFHKRPGSSGISDPTNKKGSVAVKTWTGVLDAPASEYRRITVTHAQSVTRL